MKKAVTTMLLITMLFYCGNILVGYSTPAFGAIKKTFLYDLPATFNDEGKITPTPVIPIVDLDVSLSGNGVTWARVTDIDGSVFFDGLPSGTYSLSWVWGDVGQKEYITVEDGVCVTLVNRLPARGVETFCLNLGNILP